MVTLLEPGNSAGVAMASRILIVEDSADFRDVVEISLSEAGYETCTADRGDEALKVFYSFQPDAVLLDVGLPGFSGIEVCQSIRRLSAVPVIMLTAVADTAEKLDAFEQGADDYIVKGAEMREVVARVGVALRHSSISREEATDTYSDAAVQIDFTRRVVSVRGRVAELTRTEYELLAALVLAAEPLPALQLLRKIWGPEYNSDELVKWHIGRLRKKIEEDPEEPRLVVTRRGFGYTYVSP